MSAPIKISPLLAVASTQLTPVQHQTGWSVLELSAQTGALRMYDHSAHAKLIVEGAAAPQLLLTVADEAAGMLAPPNMGPDYEARFNPIFPRLAEKHGVLFYPFFLENVAGNRELNQDDGMHPNAQGVQIIVKSILASVKALAAQAR